MANRGDDDETPGWRRYAAALPSDVRERVESELGQLEQARAPLEKKKRERRYKQQHVVAASALRAHDAEQNDHAIRPRKKRTRTQRRAAFEERGRTMMRGMRAHLDRYTALLQSLGQADAAPIGVPPHVHRIGQLVSGDLTGRAALVALCQLPRPLAHAIARAATRFDGPIGDDGVLPSGAPSARRYWDKPGRRALTHPATLRAIGAGVVLWTAAHATRRGGFVRVVRGLPRPLIARLLADPRSGYAPSIGAVFGHAANGMPGAVPTLRDAGVMQVQQPPGDKVAACDRGPSGHAFNVYWFPKLAGGWPLAEDGLEDDVLALHLASKRLAEPRGAPPD